MTIRVYFDGTHRDLAYNTPACRDLALHGWPLELRHVRDGGEAEVMIDGQWRRATIESVSAQIERLTAERDRARRLCLVYVSTACVPVDEFKALRRRAKEEGWLP